MKKINLVFKLIALFFLFCSVNVALATDSIIIETDNCSLSGTLELPAGSNACPFILIISGSGPTDRDGNNLLAGNNNCLKLLAHDLSKMGIASLRYDKRGVGKSTCNGLKENALKFETYVNDAVLWCDFLIRKNPRLSRLYIAGHSEGSLIGMLACRSTKAQGFISIAGAGYPADDLILAQIKAGLSDQMYQVSESIVRDLKNGLLVKPVPPALHSLFRESVQPYLISWFKYNPTTALSKLQIPVLIIQGTTDTQVSGDDAYRLSRSNKKAKLVIIKGMNHIFKIVPSNMQQQIESYSNPTLPVAPELIDTIAAFVLDPP